MSKIVNIQGNPYITATEDMRLKELKSHFFKELGQSITNAMRTSLNGEVLVDVRPFNDMLDQAYYMGREDGGK